MNMGHNMKTKNKLKYTFTSTNVRNEDWCADRKSTTIPARHMVSGNAYLGHNSEWVLYFLLCLRHAEGENRTVTFLRASVSLRSGCKNRYGKRKEVAPRLSPRRGWPGSESNTYTGTLWVCKRENRSPYNTWPASNIVSMATIKSKIHWLRIFSWTGQAVTESNTWPLNRLPIFCSKLLWDAKYYFQKMIPRYDTANFWVSNTGLFRPIRRFPTYAICKEVKN